MASSPMQLHRLITRLLEKSASRQVAWEPSATGKAYRTRIGDYVVQIDMPIGALTFGTTTKVEPSIQVTALDGGHIASTGPVSSMMGRPSTVLQLGTQKVLNQLWDVVANRDDDLDRLIEQLG